MCVEWLPPSYTEVGSSSREMGSSEIGSSVAGSSVEGYSEACGREETHQRNEETNNIRRHQLILLTGASDGCLHCVDCDGKVNAICEVLGHEDVLSYEKESNNANDKYHNSPPNQLKSIAVIRSTYSPSSQSSSSLIFCGFSDGAIHVVSLVRTNVHISTTSNPTSTKGRGWGQGQGQGERQGQGRNFSAVATTDSSDINDNKKEGILRDVIQMRVLMVVTDPRFSSNIRLCGVTSLSWLVLNNLSDSYSHSASHTDRRTDLSDNTSRNEIENKVENGILISGDEEGSLRLFKLKITRTF